MSIIHKYLKRSRSTQKPSPESTTSVKKDEIVADNNDEKEPVVQKQSKMELGKPTITPLVSPTPPPAPKSSPVTPTQPSAEGRNRAHSQPVAERGEGAQNYKNEAGKTTLQAPSLQVKTQRLKVSIPLAVWENIIAQSTHQYALGIKPYKPFTLVLIRVQKVPFSFPMRPDEYQVTPREYPITEGCIKKDIIFPSDLINNFDEEVAFNKVNNRINDNRSAVVTHRLLKTWFKKPEEASSGIK